MNSKQKSPTNSQIASYLVGCLNLSIDSEIERKFHSSHPRYVSLQNMKGRVIDIGAGDGGLGQLTLWPIALKDLFLVGCDLFQHSNTPQGYSSWISGGWNSIDPKVTFDGAFLIHVIEHVLDWKSLLSSTVEKLNPGSTIYIEWPSEDTVNWPTARQAWAQFSNYSKYQGKQLLSTLNFFDDSSHLSAPPTASEVRSVIKDLTIISKGTISMPNLSSGLVAKGLKQGDESNVTLGVWSHFGFAQYLVAKR